MRILDWLFPDVELARKAALARIDAIKRFHDKIDEAGAPMRRVAREVSPLFRDADMAGMKESGRTLFLPKDDIDELVAGMAKQAVLRGEMPPRDKRFYLFGAEVAEGPQRRLLGEVPTAPASKAEPDRAADT